jgi:hypothetical protein
MMKVGYSGAGGSDQTYGASEVSGAAAQAVLRAIAEATGVDVSRITGVKVTTDSGMGWTLTQLVSLDDFAKALGIQPSQP